MLEVVARGDGAPRTGGRNKAPDVACSARSRGQGQQRFLHSRAGDAVVPQIVAEFFKLVEDHDIIARGAQFVALVEDFLDVGLAAGGTDDFARHLFQPFEAFAAHALGQNGDGAAAEQGGIVGAAPAVIARGGPGGLHGYGVELTGDQTRRQAGEGRAHLVRAGGEPFAGQHHDAGLDSGQFGGQHQMVDPSVAAALGRGPVLPGDAEQIEGIEVPQSHRGETFAHPGRNQGRIAHLGEGGDEDVLFPRALDRVIQAFGMDGQVDHGGVSWVEVREKRHRNQD